MADPTTLTALCAGPAAWQQWRSAHPDDVADLADATLSGVDFGLLELGPANLFRSRLTSCRFAGTLAGVSFARAVLSSCDFKDTTLLDGSFASARAIDCEFDNAKLGAEGDTHPTTLEGALLRSCSFLDVQFRRTSVVGTQFIDCDLRRSNGLVLDDTVLRGTLPSPGTADDWSVLRRSYTGANMVFNLVAMAIFFVPWILEAIGWSAASRAELAAWHAVARVQAELAALPESEERLTLMAVLGRLVDPGVAACLQPQAGQAASPAERCRPVWHLLLGLHENGPAVVLAVVLIVYNLARLALTWFVAPMSDEERRTWHAPPRASYARLMPLHRVVRILFVAAIGAAVLHFARLLGAPVWLGAA